MTQAEIDLAWEDVRAKEGIRKEAQKWRAIQLDNFEADIARYVLLALAHLYRERSAQAGANTSYSPGHVPDTSPAEKMLENRGRVLEFGGATWDDFAALQSNELQHLTAYPELLENQIRVYQALKGRFARTSASDQGFTGPTSTFYDKEMALGSDGGARQHQVRHPQMRQGDDFEFQGLESVITIENVRTALSVDPGNSFGIWEVPLMEESECLGFAVYPKPSFFNHHCSPNIRKERDGRAIRFVTTRPVKAGEELCISYGYVEKMGWKERQKELQEGWFFQCRCSRCTAEMSTVREG